MNTPWTSQRANKSTNTAFFMPRHAQKHREATQNISKFCDALNLLNCFTDKNGSTYPKTVRPILELAKSPASALKVSKIPNENLRKRLIDLKTTHRSVFVTLQKHPETSRCLRKRSNKLVPTLGKWENSEERSLRRKFWNKSLSKPLTSNFHEFLVNVSN